MLNLARSEANKLGHNWAGCEHLVLGLLHKEAGGAATELADGGISLEEARAELTRVVGRREEKVTTISPLSPRLERVLEAAEREAALDGSDKVEPIHLLHALLAERDGVHIMVLSNIYRRTH